MRWFSSRNYGSNAVDKLARTKRRYYSADGSMEINATYPTTSTITPAHVYNQKNNGGFNVYETTNGFQNLYPTQIIYLN